MAHWRRLLQRMSLESESFDPKSNPPPACWRGEPPAVSVRAPRGRFATLTNGIPVNTIQPLTPLRPTNFRLEDEILDALRAIRERDGVPVSEQVRRALLAWIESKGMAVRAERKRASTRTRS